MSLERKKKITEQQLNEIKKTNNTNIQITTAMQQSLASSQIIKRWLQIIEILKKEEAYKQFLDNLELGEDKTIFSAYNPYKNNSDKHTHFGLSKLLNNVFWFIQRESKEKLEFYQISYKDFYNYVQNAKKVLTNMQYVPGDKIVQNEFNLEIYENPKNYSVIDLEPECKFTEDQLQRNYDIKGIYFDTTTSSFITQKQFFQLSKEYQKLTPRENEAFFGETAKYALGINKKSTMQKLKVKN